MNGFAESDSANDGDCQHPRMRRNLDSGPENVTFLSDIRTRGGPASRAVKSNRTRAAKGRFVLDFWQRTFLSTPSIPTSALSNRVSCCATKLDRPEDILCICLLFRYRKILFRLVKKCLFAWLLARLSMSEILSDDLIIKTFAKLIMKYCYILYKYFLSANN